MKLFESIKRLFEPRARPPVETMGAPADRPPPPEPTLRQPEPQQPPRSEPTPPTPANIIPAGETIEDEAEETVQDTSDVSEIRALLEAVAEEPEAAEAVAEAAAEESTPTLFEESTEAVVEVPAATPQQVAGALVLTLATPPATFTVAKAAATIGRGQENTIRLDDLSVSRRLTARKTTVMNVTSASMMSVMTRATPRSELRFIAAKLCEWECADETGGPCPLVSSNTLKRFAARPGVIRTV